jgi:putative peptidoglycan lipid II flippase
MINAGQCVMNIAFAALFVGRWGVLGLGAAFALSYLLAAAWALRILSYKVRGFAFHSVVGSVARMAVAGALAGEAAWLVADHVGANSGAGALGRVLAGSAVVVAVYAGVLVLQRAPELAALRGVTRRRV